MKIRPIILCGGSGTRLWPKSENNQAKQFINFGGWTLIEKTFERIKAPISLLSRHTQLSPILLSQVRLFSD